MTPPRLLHVLAIAVALAISTPGGSPASASGEWQAGTFFPLDAHHVPGFSPGASAAVYRLLDPQGSQIGPTIRRPALEPLNMIEVPPVPGVYTAEGWLEDESGPLAPPRTATLRFDNAAPAPAAPEGARRWLLATEPALLSIGHPPAPFPLSGIRGYAISLDRGSGGAPCSEPGWCSVGETDLRDGIGDDTIALGTLPEGTTFARVAAVSGAGVASALATAVFRVDATPPSVSLRGAPPGWSARPVHLAATAGDELSGMAAAGAAGPFTALAVDGGAPVLTPGGRAAAWVAGSGVHRIEFFARDAAGNLSGGSPGGPPPAAATVRVDEEPPRVRFAAGQDPAEPERIEATVTDRLAGADPSRGSIAVRLAGTEARFEELPTRVLGDVLVAHWESDSYPPGKYEFRATGFDRAGNAGIGANRERGGRMFLLNPVKAPVRLLAGFRVRGEATWSRLGRARHGESVRAGGLLLRAGGEPVRGARVTVTEVFAAGSRMRQRTTVARTGANGGFSLPLAPGPSRDLFASFAGSKLLSRAASGSARLAVRTAVRLRASAPTARVGGRPIVFSGRVGSLGAEGAGELPVELQFRYPGAGWSGFRTVEVDARGRFRYAYRFSDDDSRGVRFQFRAYVPGREGWPYEPASSRPVSVSGR